MRNRVFFNSPSVQLPLVLSMMILLALFLAGCGSGGGGGTSGTGTNNNNGNGNNGNGSTIGNPSLATVNGYVLDNTPSHNPVQGATITITGTTRSAVTQSNGSFVITNVPLTATSFKVASPNPVAYYNYATFGPNGSLYDLNACTLPLPVLTKGVNTLSTDIYMYLGGTNPPPPPPVGGCPAS